MAFAFQGDGLYVGDGGAALEQLWKLLGTDWVPIKGCNGRLV
jgi:hypothetical protein